MDELADTSDNKVETLSCNDEEEDSYSTDANVTGDVVSVTDDKAVDPVIQPQSKSEVANGDISGDKLEVNKSSLLKESECETYLNNVDCDTLKRDLYARKKKLLKISNALSSSDVNSLKKAAVKRGGLISDEVRRKVWPRMVGVDVYETSPRPTMKEIEEHPYYKQVILDVNRSLKRFPPSIAEKQRLAMQDQLVLLIMRVLVKNSELHYYQGYHDICVTFLLVLGEEMAFNIVNKLSKTHLRVFMDKTMERTVDVLGYLYPIIRKENRELYNFLEKSDVGVMFCLSWLITWFGHVLNRYTDVARLFDLFLASHSWMPMYLSAAIVLHREKKILEQECDMACVHALLSHLPDDLPFEELILNARQLFEMYPPKQLEAEEAPARELKKKMELSRFRRSQGFVYSVVKSIQNSVPTSKLTISIVIAAAVVMYAVVYESYKT